LDNIITERTFHTIFKEKNKWFKLSDSEKKELRGNLWKLVSDAYDTRFEGGHPRISSAIDVMRDPDLVFWKASDIDDDPQADMVVFGRETPTGVKLSGVGHDNTMDTKKGVMKQSSELLKQGGFWIEVSGAIAKILLAGFKTPYVDNKEDVEKVLGYKIDEWLGDDPDGEYPGGGWYLRTINGKQMKKSIAGRPNV
jgi:hypothetical protein